MTSQHSRSRPNHSGLRASSHQPSADELHDERTIWLSRFAATVAHEIGNPLQSIRSCIDLSREDGSLSAETAEYLDLAREELERIALLLTRLRRLYRSTYNDSDDIDLDRLIAEANLSDDRSPPRAM
jgi:signal transduction histidine kinase